MTTKPLFYTLGLFTISLNVIEDSSLNPSKKPDASIYLNHGSISDHFYWSVKDMRKMRPYFDAWQDIWHALNYDHKR